MDSFSSVTFLQRFGYFSYSNTCDSIAAVIITDKIVENSFYLFHYIDRVTLKFNNKYTKT